LLKRLTISGCALGATLGLAAPAFAQTHVKTAAAAPAAAKEWVATSGSNPNTDESDNTCRLQKNPCATIQHAIDEAPTTATVNVAAGSYPEQLLIDDKNLTLVGSTKATAPIDHRS
jgi:hypothetical protein